MPEPEWERIRDEISNDCTFDYAARRREVGPDKAAIEASEAELVDACKRIAALESQLAEVRAEGAAEERERIVAMLRSMAPAVYLLRGLLIEQIQRRAQEGK